jgi:hypothetical protein
MSDPLEEVRVLTCDYPGGSGDGTCGRPASWFYDSGTYHRPLCDEHGSVGGAALTAKPIREINPTKVPGWKPMKPVDPLLWASVAAERYDDPPPMIANPMPSTAAPPTPSRPPLKDALVDVAVAVCELLGKRIKEWGEK